MHCSVTGIPWCEEAISFLVARAGINGGRVGDRVGDQTPRNRPSDTAEIEYEFNGETKTIETKEREHVD